MSLDGIGIVSENIERAVEFYGLLGIHLKRHGDADHFEGLTPSGVRLLVDSVAVIRSFEPEWKKIRGNGVNLCFKRASPADVDAVYAKLTRAGFEGIKDPWDAFWGQRYACVSDPDGNQIDLFATL